MPHCGRLTRMNFLLRIAATAVAVAIAAWIIPGIWVTGGTTLEMVLTLTVISLVIGVVNAFVKPLAMLITGCLIILTLGLFLLVVNAGMLLLSAWICQQFGVGFYVDGWWSALLGSIIISIVSGLINGLTGVNRPSVSD
jgi:putative membrane protein